MGLALERRESSQKRKRRESFRCSIVESSIASSLSTPTIIESSSLRMELDKWNKHSEFYEPIFLQLISQITHGEYKEIGKKFNVEFWESFTLQFNARVAIALSDPNLIFPPDPEPTTDHGNFCYDEVIMAGRVLRQKYHDYKSLENYPNLELFERCYKKCGCATLARFPTSRNVGAGRFRRPTIRSRSSIGGSRLATVNTPEGRDVMRNLTKMYSERVVNQRQFDKGIVYFNVCVSKCIGFLRLNKDDRVRFVNELN